MTATHRLPNIARALREAVTLQQQGRLREAEDLHARAEGGA